MLKARIIIITVSVALVAALFALPKVVVDNESDNVTGESTETSSDTQAASPSPAADEDQALRVDQLRRSFGIAENKEKSIIFADSLATLFMENGNPDSAAMFIEVIAQEEPVLENWRRAGNAYYEAFTTSMDDERRKELASRARGYYEKVITEAPSDFETKNKLAMTMLTSSNPMEGIMMLRQIVEDDPENEIALFNLGALSMQSNQFDKAVERFEQVVRLYPGNIQAQYFLGVSYLETGQKQQAREQFELVKSMDADPEIQAAADSYLESL